MAMPFGSHLWTSVRGPGFLPVELIQPGRAALLPPCPTAGEGGVLRVGPPDTVLPGKAMSSAKLMSASPVSFAADATLACVRYFGDNENMELTTAANAFGALSQES